MALYKNKSISMLATVFPFVHFYTGETHRDPILKAGGVPEAENLQL